MKLYYRECGKGQPMILLHGNGEDSIYFEDVYKRQCLNCYKSGKSQTARPVAI